MSCGGGGFGGAPADTITGTLTPGVIPVASAPHILVDSIAFQAAGVISIAGALSVLAGNLLVSRSSAGIVLATVANTNGAATGHAVLSLDSTAGDAFVRIDSQWSFGRDVSDSGAWVLSKSGTLGTTNVLRIDASTIISPNSLVVTNFSEVCNSAGSSAAFYWSSGTFSSTSRRWRARKDNTAESGGNAGSDWQLEALTDGGVLIDAPIKIFRVAGGNMELARPVKLAGVLISTAANESTGAGSALLGANSPAATLTAPYTWITWKTSDGSTVYMPVWK